MISFACKPVSLQDIVMCSFDLNKTEYSLLVFLLEQEEALTVQDIALKRTYERSTVQKAISSLLSKELIERRQLNLSTGGYRFIYAIKDKDELKTKIRQIVDGWYKQVTNAIDTW